MPDTQARRLRRLVRIQAILRQQKLAEAARLQHDLMAACSEIEWAASNLSSADSVSSRFADVWQKRLQRRQVDVVTLKSDLQDVRTDVLVRGRIVDRLREMLLTRRNARDRKMQETQLLEIALASKQDQGRQASASSRP
ncbi:MAG: hypothetical protein AAF732_07110 [Pseudomonadota bacterium]